MTERLKPAKPAPRTMTRKAGNSEASGGQKLTVKHAMTEKVIDVKESMNLYDAGMLMRSHCISGMPVTDKSGQVVGVLSEKDIAKSLNRAMEISTPEGLLDLVLGLGGVQPKLKLEILNEHLHGKKVKDVMSADPVMVSSEAPLDLAAKMMRERKINRLPVMDGKKLVGIITRHDVLAAF